MSRAFPLADDHLPAVQAVMQLHPEASIYRLSELVAHRLKLHRLSYATLGKFLKRHGLEAPAPRRAAPAAPRKTGPAEVRDQARAAAASVSPDSVTRDEARPAVRRPRVALTPAHLPLVRRVVDANPGASLAKLCPLVAQACGLPHLTDFTLHRFLSAHHIERVVPAHVLHRSERLRARGVLQFPNSLALHAPAKGAPDVAPAHLALAAVQGTAFALGGLVKPEAPSPLVHGLPGGQVASERLRRIWLDEARRESTAWLSAAGLRHAARAAMAAALSLSRETPDPEEFDPDSPRSWFTVHGFAQDVADLFRLAIFELAYAHRPNDERIEHECNQLGRLAGAVEVMRALSEKAS